MKLNDIMIRENLVGRISRYKDCKVIEEMNTASYKARADFVAINGHVHGYEIKSDRDTLIRLPSQVQEYDLSFEKNTIIVGEKYRKQVEAIVPEYWGIITVTKQNEHQKIQCNFLRNSKINPKLNIIHLFNLLVKKEVVIFYRKNSTILEKYKPEYCRMLTKISKSELISIAHLFNQKEQLALKRYVRETLKIRS